MKRISTLVALAAVAGPVALAASATGSGDPGREAKMIRLLGASKGAITGGTGRYRRARGTFAANPVTEGRERITMRVLH